MLWRCGSQRTICGDLVSHCGSWGPTQFVECGSKYLYLFVCLFIYLCVCVNVCSVCMGAIKGLMKVLDLELEFPIVCKPSQTKLES